MEPHETKRNETKQYNTKQSEAKQYKKYIFIVNDSTKKSAK